MPVKKKIRVAILFGGKSAEHEVSLLSAKSVIEAIDKNKYDVVLIGIDKNGKWFLNNSTQFLLNANNPKLIKLNKSNIDLAIKPGSTSNKIISQSSLVSNKKIDVIFPMLHGPYGEDGSMQGLLKIMGLPFVGAGVLGSAVSMDKDVMKRLLRDAGIPVAKFIVVKKHEEILFKDIKKQLGLPLFIKPANLGSSVGISKVNKENEFKKAIDEAFKYDTKIIIEEFIKGDEIFCAVLGNEKPIASVPGKLITDHEFYDYSAKYIDEIQMEIPAKISPNSAKKIRDISIKAYKALCCEGMARVDLFLTKSGDVYCCEVNTIPGFTSHSWYPTLWKASGVGYSELIDKLINLAIERHENQKKLKTSFK